MLTPDEIERRRHFLTATDMSKVLGLSPWGNASDVYWDKVRGSMQRSNPAIEAGNLLEPAVMEWAHRQLGGVVAGDWRVHEDGVLACSLDGLTACGDVVECKTSGITGPGSPAQWGEAGTDQIPDYYLIQVQTQLLVTGASRAYVPALIGGRGFVLYVVQPNVTLHDTILCAATEFWVSHVQERSQPVGQSPRLETLKHIRREPNKTVDVSTELVLRLEAAKKAAKAANDELEAAQAATLAAMGDAECGRYEGGQFTYYEQTRKGYTVEDSTFRVLRHKSTRKALT